MNLLVFKLVFKPALTWPGLLIVLIGVPVCYGWRRVSGRGGKMAEGDV